MKFASVGSGSRGNALVVSHAGTVILLDCGLSLKLLSQGLLDLGLSIDAIDAVLITHEHSDHIKGLSSLLRKRRIPTFMSEGTAFASGWHDSGEVRFVRDRHSVEFGSFSIEPVIVPHDAREPCQFVISEKINGQSRARRLGVLTDIGSASHHVIDAYSGCDALVLETNHDVQMLRQGPYPPSLKARVMGDWGHLSNEQARDLLDSTDNEALQWLVLAHISEQNNSIELAKGALLQVFPDHSRIRIADQDSGFDWLSIE